MSQTINLDPEAPWCTIRIPESRFYSDDDARDYCEAMARLNARIVVEPSFESACQSVINDIREF